jgi:alpha-ketoglutarate-dependent taurine dioxygenase
LSSAAVRLNKRDLRLAGVAFATSFNATASPGRSHSPLCCSEHKSVPATTATAGGDTALPIHWYLQYPDNVRRGYEIQSHNVHGAHTDEAFVIPMRTWRLAEVFQIQR